MAAIPSREVTTSQIEGVGFSFYSDEEVRKLSVKEIQSPLTLNNLKHPIAGGLYDPALGPLDFLGTCDTCGLKYRACPGHFGRIELAVPVYNPLVFGTLYKLLRCTCLHCFKFRMAQSEVEKYKQRMKLLSEGHLVEASRVRTGSSAQVSKASNDILGDEGEDNDLLKMQGGSHSVMHDDDSHYLPESLKSHLETVHTVEAARSCQLEFFSRMPPGQCANCGAHNPAIKREGSSKLFQKPLDVRKLTANLTKGITITSALAGVAHNSQEADNLELQIAEQEAGKAQKGGKKEDESEYVPADKKVKVKGAKAKDDSAPSKAPEKSATGVRPRYMTPAEVREVMRRLWANEGKLLQYLYALNQKAASPKKQLLASPGLKALRDSDSFRSVYNMFFVQTVAVPPNNVRPMSKMGDLTFEHPQNVSLVQIINFNLDLVSMEKMQREVEKTKASENQLGPVGGIDLGRSLRLWLSLQNSVNALYDTTTAEGTNSAGQGIRQLLEKKEGLFRKNMMGKRVNFACRSVISPDPYLGSGEIGVPPYFAVRLSVPERVTPLNVEILRDMVIRGPHKHPGANAVEDENGRMVNLAQMPLQKREAIAKQLLSRQNTVVASGGAQQGVAGKIVYRHLRDGDIMLTNRQPTLHKPGLMAHRARILKGERTIRMHYANCSTFNADFDGDEINLHVPQDLHARAEGYEIVHADHQYIVPTDGKPIRGLIQDHVVAGVQLTKRDTFLSKGEFTQLLYNAVCPTRPGLKDASNLKLPVPAILRPEPLWTGKQVISAILERLTAGKAPMTLTAPCKTSEKYWGKTNNEELLIFQTGDLVTGVMDKAQYGKFGLVHSVQELYGNVVAGTLLSVLSRLWTYLLQRNGFTCGINDLLLTTAAEKTRGQLIDGAERKATCASAEYAGIPTDDIAHVNDTTDPAFERKQREVQRALSEKYRSSASTGAVHDRKVTSSLQPISSEVVDVCLPGGQVKPFPVNCLSMMTVTGAKGSQVNFSQISCLLGQQELEGRRVPRMASGKTLPCFGPYEGGARSGGYISDRFLTGLRPQEYYFHCMAGREGLVDTTVKTSRSGYLQRCLVKNLESLRTHYDGTVRDCCDGSVVQFQYGEDGIDVLNNSFMREFAYLARNVGRLQEQQLPDAREAAESATAQTGSAALQGLEKEIAKESRWRQKQLDRMSRGKKAEDPSSRIPVSGQYFNTLLGSTSELFADKLGTFMRSSPELCAPKKGKKRKSEAAAEEEPGGKKAGPTAAGSEADFKRLMDLRYMRSLAAPGEAVGVLAAQSVGEPSTQMTLNTFHMAGRGEANVTLGIPRLRELFMTASKSIKTPVMTLPLLPGKTKEDAETLVKKFRRIKLAEVLEDISIEEAIVTGPAGNLVRQYTVKLQVLGDSQMPSDAGVHFDMITQCFRSEFVKHLKVAVKKELLAFERNSAISTMAVLDEGATVTAAAPGSKAAAEGDESGGRKAKRKDDEDENAEDNEEYDEGKLRFAGGRSEKGAMYDVGDAEDKEIAAQQVKDAQRKEELPDDDDDAKETSPGTPTKAAAAAKKDAGLETDGSANAESRVCTARVCYPLTCPKVLMLELVEALAARTMLRHTTGIEKCYIIDGIRNPDKPEEVPPPAMQTDGINFEAAWIADGILDVDRLFTNDVGSILGTYGVEAARATLMREVSSVFGAYGIAVDPRHLGLIADFMTHQGGYRACSRGGIENSRSTFLKITFETASHFLTDATLKGVADDLASPASRIVLGRVVQLGTGTFDLRQKIEKSSW